VLADSPTYYWPLTSETLVYPDASGNADNATAGGVVTPNTSGPLSATGSAYFVGTEGILTAAGTAQTGPQTYTQLAWVKTTSDGVIMSFANSTPPGSTSADWDRHLWIDPSGYVVAGVYPSSFQTVTSTSTVNNGAWHFVAATVSSAGLKLYVDGTLQATDSSGTSAQTYSGYWSIGAGKLSSWADTPTLNSAGDGFLNGSLAGVAVLPSALTGAQISALYSAANFNVYSGTVINDGPSEYWPLTAPANACSAAVATVSITISGTTTCLLPVESAGTACPAVNTGGLPLVDVVTAVASTAVTLGPGVTGTLTINIADNGTLPAALTGVDVLMDATVTAELGNWAAGGVYSDSQTQL
jgi:hypothetical protein